MLDVETGNKIRSLSIVCPCLKYVQSLSNVQSLSTLCPPIKMWYSGGLKNCWTGYGQTLDANIQFLSKYLRNKLFWTGYGQTLDAYVQCLSKLSLVGHPFDVLYIFDKNCWTCCWQNLYVDRPMTEIGQLLDRSWIFCQKIVQGLSDHTRGTCTHSWP